MRLNKLTISLRDDRPYLGWRLINLAATGILALSVLGAIYLIYQNIYSAISDTAVILSLSSRLNLEIVDIGKYNKSGEAIAKKKKPIAIPGNLRNIFIYGASAGYERNTSSTS